MTKEHKKKKPGRVKKIFKYIGLGILTLLILLALVVEAPKKLVILLLIILAAFTALPRPYRKYFLLTAAGTVIALIVWIFLPEDNEGWRPYTFDEEVAALEAKYAVPDEENAALIYNEIFETPDIDSNQPEFFLKSTPSSNDKPWLSKEHPKMAEWLKGHQDTIAKLIEASQKEKCHFPIFFDSWDFDRKMEQLALMRRCAQLLISAGNNDIGEGRMDTGLEKHLCILRMADHLYQQPHLIYFLSGFGLERLASKNLNRFVIESETTKEQFRLIINASENMKNNWGIILKNVIETDKLIVKNTFCSMSYEVNPEGKVRFSRNPYAVFEATFPDEMPKPNYWQKKLYKAKTIFAWLYIPPTPQKAGEIFDKCFDIYHAMTKPDFKWKNKPQESGSKFTKKYLHCIRFNLQYIAQMMTCLSEESYYSLHDVYLRILSMRHGSRLLIAIRQYKDKHGRWPKNLEEIKSAAPAEAFIDPVTGNPLQYGNHGEDFSLYGEKINIWPG
jgi:hypothetical protein